MDPQITWKSSDEELEYYPPFGRPTSATVTGYREGYSELWASEPVVLDPYTDTITGAQVGDVVLDVTDTTDAEVERRYWVRSSTGGFGQEVFCVDIPSATTIRIAHPLGIDIASGTIEGHGLRRTMAASETSQRTRKTSRAFFEMTYGTKVRKKSLWFNIVALPLTFDDVQITETDLTGAETEFVEAVDNTGLWRFHVRQAWHDICLRLNENHKPDLLRTRGMLRNPMLFRTLYHRYNGQEAKQADYLAKYNEAIAIVLKSTEAWYDSEDDLIKSMFGTRTVQVGNDLVPSCMCDDDEGYGDGIINEGWPAGGYMQVT